MALSGCASAPAQESAAAPAITDISQAPGLESALYVSESASVTRPLRPAPSAEDRARAAMQKQTEGMAPGAVAGGPKDQVIIRISEANAPKAAPKPKVVIPALQPDAQSRPPVEESSWKTPLPPLRNLED
jgi:hypothetical protein